MLPVPVYVGKRFTAVLEGSLWQPLVCEHCHVEWAFRVRVTGIGRGESPYMLDDAGASRRAEERARVALEEDRRALSEGVTRNVPCPSCGKLQRDMVTRLRAAHAPGWRALGAASVVVGTMMALRGLTGGAMVAWLASAAVPIALGIASFARRRELQRRFDPNGEKAIGSGTPYRTPGNAALRASDEAEGAPEAITREQYDAACTEAEAQGKPPLPAIRWGSVRTKDEPA